MSLIYHEVFDGNQVEPPTLMPTLKKVLTRKPLLPRLFIEYSFLRHGLMCPPPVCETDSPLTSTQIVAQGVGLSSVPGITAK